VILNFLLYTNIACRGLAQLVAYTLWERGVVSSSLASPTKNIMQNIMQNFKIYSRAIILNKKRDKVLLIKKNNKQKIGPGSWLLPGGTLEFNEEIELSLIREIKEETNLKIIDLQLLASKKMIIEDTHWLGIYFLVNIENEDDLINVEKDKHESIKFVSLQEVPSLKDYSILQFIKGIDINREFFNASPVLCKDHTMEKALPVYIFHKIHSLLRSNIELFSRIKIIGNYDRSIHVSKDEKNDKLFNFKRPTAFIDGDILYICCFPSFDYIYHYAKLIATYLASIDSQKEVSYILPSTKVIENIFLSTNIKSIPDADIIIFGNIDKIGIFEDKEFNGNGDFLWKIGKIGKKNVLLLGCKFSIWGSSGYDLIKLLAKNNRFSTFIYIGKLGSLSHNILPNQYIATGSQSYVNGKSIKWKNIFQDACNKNIIFGDHVTCPSVLDETKKQLTFFQNKGDFIDPEIGNIALACKEFDKIFSYLHIISDNVMNHNESENLSNERKQSIRKKRNNLFQEIGQILKNNI
jgi:ADP-ribose pyrophosphatase YjhB (NUDIX family)